MTTSHLHSSLTDAAIMTYKLPFNKSNLPKQLFINNEVSPPPSPSIHPPLTH